MWWSGNSTPVMGVQLTVLRGSGAAPGPTLSFISATFRTGRRPGVGIVYSRIWPRVLGALVLTIPAAALIRRLGREQVRSGGAVAAAFDADGDGPVERMTERQMEAITTIEFEAPRGMSAVEGALIVDEKVKDHHKTAWMLESAIRGEIEIRPDDDKIHRGDSIPAPTVSPILSEMFGGRDSIDAGQPRHQVPEGLDPSRQRAEGLAARVGSLGSGRSVSPHVDRVASRPASG